MRSVACFDQDPADQSIGTSIKLDFPGLLLLQKQHFARAREAERRPKMPFHDPPCQNGTQLSVSYRRLKFQTHVVVTGFHQRPSPISRSAMDRTTDDLPDPLAPNTTCHPASLPRLNSMSKRLMDVLD
jgi:hypothetical protein